MANWNLPTISDPYEDIPGLLKELAVDAATLFVNEPTNPIDGTIKLVRSPVKFQERAGGTWNDLVLSVEGGGTGSATPLPQRDVLTANRTYYVRTDGSDSNDGLANDAMHAFLTIQHAVNVTAGLDCRVFDVTIQVADGTYTNTTIVPNMLGTGRFTITGNAGSPSNVLISTTASACFTFFGCQTSNPFLIANLEMRTATSGDCITATNWSHVGIQNVVFGACAGSHMTSGRYSNVTILGSYAIGGGAQHHYRAMVCGAITRLNAATITLTSTPAFSDVFAWATNLGLLSVFGWTFSGSATGTRYRVENNGMIWTSGGGPTYLPGNNAGTVINGGQYV